MTLLTTEFHNPTEPNRTVIVFAADRRISKGILRHDEQVKIFGIPGINAGIGYFGLAEVPNGNGRIPMAQWLQEFLDNDSYDSNLNQLATRLAQNLNKEVPRDWRRSEISGFHIAGFNTMGLPEFWYVRNVEDDRETLMGEYRVREEFQRRDVVGLQPGEVQYYRNGDIRAHVAVWAIIDKSFGRLLNFQDFRPLTTPEEYASWVKYKMEMIARFYEEFCIISVIGTPVDAFSITLS